MSVLSLLDPRGWFATSTYRAKLSGGQEPSTTGHLSSAGRIVTADLALQLSTYWACVRIIAETVGALPLQLFESAGNGGRRARTDHPLYRLIHDQPNADQTAVVFWEAVVACLAIWGNAFVLKRWLGSRIVAIVLLRPGTVVPRREADGSLRYRYTDPARGTVQDFDEREMMHVPGFGLGDLLGLSPLTYARQTLGMAMAADETAGVTFANGMKMSGWFKYKGGNGILKDDQREQARKVLVDPYVGAGNAAKVGILEGDFDWVAASIPAHDAQLLESRRFSVEEICRWFGVPPIVIGHAAQGQTMWGTGVEQVVLGWLTTGLRPYLVRIEQSIKKHLLQPEEKATLYAEFNLDALLRADSKARAENYARMAQNGIYTRNELRALENMKAMPGGDDLTVQTNLVPIHLLGEIATLPRDKPVEPGAALQTDRTERQD